MEKIRTLKMCKFVQSTDNFLKEGDRWRLLKCIYQILDPMYKILYISSFMEYTFHVCVYVYILLYSHSIYYPLDVNFSVRRAHGSLIRVSGLAAASQ